jgi:hypothetical protein
MNYSELMIQAYAEAKGITWKEAAKYFGASGLKPEESKGTRQISDQQAQELLNDLRKDPKGVLAWVKDKTANQLPAG